MISDNSMNQSGDIPTKIVFGNFDHWLQNLLPSDNVFILTDGNVSKYHNKRFPKFPTFILPTGEEYKKLETAIDVYRWLLENHADRQSFILGIGGGVVCDLTGFVASTFLRGVRFGFVSTTLLSQVDASVGGKNGVNFDGNKNIIGTITQPDFVICDTNMLKTLPEEQFINGLAEVVKHAVLSGGDHMRYLENHQESIKQRNSESLLLIVKKSVEYKKSIVLQDERETHLRKLLNLGHTLGHAIESSTGMLHGLAVSVGLAFAAQLSCSLGYLSDNTLRRILKLQHTFSLPTKVSVNHDDVLHNLLRDKKRFGETIDFVFIRDIGDCFIKPIDIKELNLQIVRFFDEN